MAQKTPIPKRLIWNLVSGQSFLLVGSGPSSAMGYPSWKALAETACTLVDDTGESESLQSLMQSKDYPEVFERVSRIVGWGRLLPKLQNSMTPRENQGELYNIICNWPSPCILTTNYDDEIQSHLSRNGKHYTTLANSQVDMRQITATSSNRIVKLHGDLSTPTGLVLTTSQYSEFEVGGARDYHRTKLTSIFQMVPVFVIGHSMTDSNFRWILQSAEQSASPTNPIYMLLANASNTDIDKYFRQYNIHIISYETIGHDHSESIQILRQIDKFVQICRYGRRIAEELPAEEDTIGTISLYVHSKMNFGTDTELVQRSIQPQILHKLAEGPCSATAIVDALKPKSLSETDFIAGEIENSLSTLADNDLIGNEGADYFVTDKGRNFVDDATALCRTEEDQFYGAIRRSLEGEGSTSEVDAILDELKKSLRSVFYTRGLSSAQVLFAEGRFAKTDVPDLFDALFPRADTVGNQSLRTKYCEVIVDLLTNPNTDQKNYLARLSQGFFAYHMFGMDPHGHEARKTILTDATWVLDSNVLLRVVAKGSTQHKYAQSLLTLMTEFGISPVTTKRLVEEANGVFQWMLDKLTGVGHGREHSALLNVISNPTYRENPFVDGFILGHESGTWRNIREYIESVNWHSESGFVHALAELGVKVVEVPDEETDSSEDSTEILVSQLSDYRRGRGTLRSDTQVENEAEVMRLITAIRSEGGVGDSDQGKTAYFVSTSHALDNAFNKEGIITWSPSTLYNQLVYLTGKILDGEEAFQALTESFYSYGISIIDDNIYSAYFSQNITEANATFEEELDNYVVSMHEHVGEQKNEHDSVKEAFRNTPALHRPMFVEQMGWRAARKKDEELRKERREVERKEAQIEALREGNEKERRELVQEMEQKKKELEKKEEERKRHFAGRMRNLNKGRSKKGKRR